MQHDVRARRHDVFDGRHFAPHDDDRASFAPRLAEMLVLSGTRNVALDGGPVSRGPRPETPAAGKQKQ